MRRIGTHTNPPPRLPGETTEEYMRVLQTCDWEFSAEECDARGMVPTASRERPTPVESERNRAARQFMAASSGKPKLATIRKPERTTFKAEPSQIIPSICVEHLQDMRNGRPRYLTCRVCHRREQRKAPRPVEVVKQTKVTPDPIPCPICRTPFVPRRTGRGTLMGTCSISCSRKQGASTRDTAEYRAKLAAAATGRSTSDAHREHLSQSISRYHAERRSEMAS